MRVPAPGTGAHLTYCTNIHAGESWAEVRRNLERFVVPVRNRVAPDRRFGVGLRLSARAADELAADAAARDELRGFLEQHALYVFTLNGFPYGAFHVRRVKEAVYRPDWLEEDRLTYTNRLAEILAALLPDGGDLYGSISTVPLGDRVRVADTASCEAAVERVARHVVHLARLREETGKLLVLALEPEPCCALETSAEAAELFRTRLFAGAGAVRLGVLLGTGEDAAVETMQQHVGVCLDACHAAVQFESAAHAVHTLQSAGLRIAKVQLSAGIRLPRPDAAAIASLRDFADDVYLHQVVVRRNAPAEPERYLDMPQALAAHGRRADPESAPPDEEWRVHVHVPLFQERLGALASTQSFVRDLLALQRREGVSSHLEVETYTWDVLPSECRGADVVDDIARELTWVLDHLHAHSTCP